MLQRYLSLIILSLLLASCSNQFAYKANDWVKVTETSDENPQTVYLDKNRVDCKDDKCRTWLKMVFGKEKPINFSGDKKGEVSGVMMVKRIDAAVDYDCKFKTSLINAYQLYDKSDKMIDKKWIKNEAEYAKPGTVHGDVLKHVCK